MRIFLAALLLAITVSQAHAIKRHNIASKSCGEVQSIVSREGAAILRYPSKSNKSMLLYDRYVANGKYCEGSKYAKFTSVPTRDKARCPMYYCRDHSHSN